jgi:signal transduction histidine kinase
VDEPGRPGRGQWTAVHRDPALPRRGPAPYLLPSRRVRSADTLSIAVKLPALRPRTPLDRLRLRLTAWYVGAFAATLLIIRAILLLMFSRQVSADLNRSLRETTAEVVRAVRIREAEGAPAAVAVADAASALDYADRPLYVFGGDTPLVHGTTPDPRIVEAARAARRLGAADREFATPAGQRWRLHAQRFATRGGGVYVSVAVADLAQVEAERQRLVSALLRIGFLALLLVAAGGIWLSRISVRPVEAVMDQMRRFVADAAHELRTPLAVLRGRAEVALELERDPAAYQAALGEILRESERLGAIVQNLFTLARADAGERPVALVPFYLDDVASDAVQAAGMLARARGVHLELGDYDEAPARGDAELVRQMLMVLLDNAVKFTPAGGTVHVDVGVRDGRATVEVRDTGIGIGESDLPRIFDRFYRADPARTRGGGAGLGLSIARWIADQHHAEIAVQSAEGAGTRFTVRFPPAVIPR